jgi:hypothetical protein
MQRDQSKFFEEVIYRLEAQDEKSRSELLEIVDRRMDLEERRHREEGEIAQAARHIDQCSRQGGNARQAPQCVRADLGPMEAESGEGHRGRYDPHADSLRRPSSAVTDGPVGAERPRAGAPVGAPRPGYLPDRIEIVKHEENSIDIFEGGPEGRKIWPGYHANFAHLARSYHWGYELKGLMLARKCRLHALAVLQSLKLEQQEDYDALVGAFDKAYVPKEWARTYRGALSKICSGSTRSSPNSLS